ncbi:hypothetical protein [Paractinoplanes maris]|uniref:hypothetical protein n=1 Tax=Paractinoplanes maris TaxID=1734446 RepID=UPI00202007A2|nr:hypothetical protein [Actinoplanes maris]
MIFHDVLDDQDWDRELWRFAERQTLPAPVLRAGNAVTLAAPLHDSDIAGRPTAPGNRAVLTLAGSAVDKHGPAIAAAVGATHISVLAWADVAAALGRQATGEIHAGFVAVTADLEESQIDGIREDLRMLADDGPSVHAGFLVGPDLAAVSWLVAKALAWPWRRGERCEVLSVHSAASSSRVSGGDVVLKSDATFERLAPQLLGGHVGLLSLMAHGRDDVIHLQDTVLCANHVGKLVTTAPPNVPTCAFTGRCCRDDVDFDRILAADRVRADVVFTNSCMGLRVRDGMFPEPYLLAHGFARGAVAGYIGCSSLVSGREKVNLLTRRAMESGLSLGQTVSLLNDHLGYEGSDIPAFGLVGAPWLAWAPIDVPALTFADPRGLQSDAAAAGRDTLVLEGGRGDLFFVSSRTAPLADRMTALPPRTLTDRAEVDSLALRAGAAIENLGDLPLIGLRTARQGNLLVQLRDQIASTARALSEALEGSQPERARKRLASLRTAVARAEEDVATSLFERGTTSSFEFEDLWCEILNQRSEGTVDRTCPRCDRALKRLSAEHPLFRRLRRQSLVCPQCTLVEDLDPRGDVVKLELITAPYWVRGTEQRVTLRISVDEQVDRPVTGYAAIFAKNSAKYGVGVPPPERLELTPGSVTELSVTAQVLDRAGRYHQDFLKGFVVSKGTVSFASCPIWYRPPGAYE